MKWIKFTVDGKHPPERRVVLVQLDAIQTRYGGYPASVVVGYLRYAAGDKDSPFFVTPGIEQHYVPDEGVETNVLGKVQRRVTHWCDCLGDGFECPLWQHKTMNRPAQPQEAKHE